MGLWSDIDVGRWVRENSGCWWIQSREAKPLSSLSLMAAKPCLLLHQVKRFPTNPRSTRPSWSMNPLKGQWDELATSLPPSFSDWSKTKLKSPMQSHGLTKSSLTAMRESQKVGLLSFLGAVYTRQNPRVVWEGSKKHHAVIFFLFERKLSSSTPNLQVRTRPLSASNYVLPLSKSTRVRWVCGVTCEVSMWWNKILSPIYLNEVSIFAFPLFEWT